MQKYLISGWKIDLRTAINEQREEGSNWMDWQESNAVEVLKPERAWEGGDAPPEPSVRSNAYGNVNQLRDPAIYEEDGRVFLLYAVAGESGIGIVELIFSE